MTRSTSHLLPARRLRPLPRSVTPLHNETHNSYIERLAWANRMLPIELHEHLADSSGPVRSGEIPLPRALAQLAGQPLERLLLALPDLATADLADTIPPGRDRLHPGWRIQPGCRLCLLAKNVRHARLWVPPGTTICPRHQRWTGAHGQQFDISALPEITHAHRRHRRMIHRRGWQAAARAMDDATSICWAWWETNQHTKALNRRRSVLRGPAWPSGRSALTLAACGYPDIVALAELLAAPDLRSLAFTGDRRDYRRFVHHARERVASGYPDAPHHDLAMLNDPLALWIERERHHTDTPAAT